MNSLWASVGLLICGVAHAGSDAVLSDGFEGGRPGPTNTGVPPGTTLTPGGSMTLDTPDQVLDARDITGCIVVTAPRVTIRRTRVRCSAFFAVDVAAGGSLTIEDSELDGSPAMGIGAASLKGSNLIARRVSLHGASDGLKTGDHVVLEDSWLHDFYLGDDDHADGVQSTDGNDVIIRRNFIDVVERGQGHGEAPNSAIQIGIENGPNSNWVIENNWLYGGNWTVHVDSGTGTNNRISNNRVGRGTSPISGQPPYPQYGPIATAGNWVESGNVWDDNGAAID